MAGWDVRGLSSVVVLSSISVVGRRLDEVPVGADGVGGVGSRVGVVGGVVGVVEEPLLSVELGLSLSLPLAIEGLPVAEVVERRLVEAPGVAGVGSGVTVVVEGGVVHPVVAVGPVEEGGVSLSLSLWLGLSLSLSLGKVDSSDRVSQISAAGSIAVGGVGSNGGGGVGIVGVATESLGGVGGVAGVSGHGSGVTVVGVEGGVVEPLVVAVGPVEGIRVSLSLSGSEGSATDLRGENMKRRKSRIVILPQ